VAAGLGWLMIKRTILLALKVILPPLAALFSPIFYLIAKTGIGVSICRRWGFQPILRHYYEPIPEYETVPPGYFEKRHDSPGVTLDMGAVREVLQNLAAYGPECEWPEGVPRGGGFFAANPSFGYSSAAILHAMIRWSKARKVLEIGGGYSSLISVEALKKNSPDGDFHFICVEPFPNDLLERLIRENSKSSNLVQKKAEELNPDFFIDLKENDLLFIDSSHVSKLNSDVNFLYLNVLPKLNRGVLIHIHDIYYPYDYPQEHFYGQKKIFWNEQYLLSAFLTDNPKFEIIFPGYYLQKDFGAAFQSAFPYYDPQQHRLTSSFWIRKIA
jgi:hypothetical protein